MVVAAKVFAIECYFKCRNTRIYADGTTAIVQCVVLATLRALTKIIIIIIIKVVQAMIM